MRGCAPLFDDETHMTPSRWIASPMAQLATLRCSKLGSTSRPSLGKALPILDSPPALGSLDHDAGGLVSFGDQRVATATRPSQKLSISPASQRGAPLSTASHVRRRTQCLRRQLLEVCPVVWHVTRGCRSGD